MNQNPFHLAEPTECCGARIVVKVKGAWMCPCGHLHDIDVKPGSKTNKPKRGKRMLDGI